MYNFPTLEEVIADIDRGEHPASKGWTPMIRELSVKLLATGEDIRVTQIKSKWGGLRYYIDGGSKHVDKIIEDYEAKSFEICEVCGNPGKLYATGWHMTLCPICKAIRDKQNKVEKD